MRYLFFSGLSIGIFLFFKPRPIHSENPDPYFINLLYSSRYAEVLNPINSPTSLNLKETINRYSNKNRLKDSRFLNINYRENGVDVSKKVIYLKKGMELEYKLNYTLNHKIYITLKKNSEVHIYFNNNKLKDNLIQSTHSFNKIKIIAETDTIITTIYLAPLESKKKGDLYFIVIDSLRGDVPGFNGGKYNATPNLDEYSEKTYVFQKHLVNSSWTRPSTLIFFTGLYPSKSYINLWDYPVFNNEREAFYTSKIKPLPVVLAENGYKTILIGNNPFFTDHRYIGLDIGFEEVYEFSFLDRDTPQITSKFLKFMQENSIDKRPLFIFLNYNDPHKPYEPPFEFLQKIKVDNSMDSKKRDYLGEVAYVDNELSTVLRKIKESENYNQSLLIITSDHGEVMQPAHAKSKFTDVYTLYGHGQGLYEEDIHTPLLLKIPSQVSGKKISKISRSIDLYPTILDYLQIQNTEILDGTTLRSILEDREISDRDYYGESRGVKGVRKNGWKYMKKTFEYHREGPAWDGIVGREDSYLFDLKADPLEIFPISNSKIEEELAADFSKGNLLKNKYYIRMSNFSNENKDINLNLSIPYGMINLESKKNLMFNKYFSREINIKPNMEETLIFSIYPDVVIPDINVQINHKSPGVGELGVGEFDLYPKNCNLRKLECLEIYQSINKEPPKPKNFRVQIWYTPAGKKMNSEKVILEKEAIQILKKQGYIQ